MEPEDTSDLEAAAAAWEQMLALYGPNEVLRAGLFKAMYQELISLRRRVAKLEAK